MNTKGLPTLRICNQKFNYLNYSNRTKDNYIGHISRFLKSQDKSCAHLNSKDFQEYIDTYKFTSISNQNQVISAIKFLYRNVLDKKYDKVSFTRPRNDKKLPKVVDGIFIKNQLLKIENLKHKAILSLTYSAGLRVSEVVNMGINDIDSKRMIIHIKNTKGGKDRIVPLSSYILDMLREYFKEYRPIEYLFNGLNSEKYSIRSCQLIYKKYIDKAGHIHTLRHSCFTDLLESGTDIRIIQKIAGHSNIKTAVTCWLHIIKEKR